MPVVTCEKCGAQNRVDTSAARTRQPVCGRCGAELSAAAAAPVRPVTVTDATFAQTVLQAGDRPVLLDFWAAWCGPCRVVGPVLEQLAAEADGRYTIAKLNVDENKRTAAQFRIQSIPTMLIFKRGQVVDQLVGAQPKQAIAARLAAHT